MVITLYSKIKKHRTQRSTTFPLAVFLTVVEGR